RQFRAELLGVFLRCLEFTGGHDFADRLDEDSLQIVPGLDGRVMVGCHSPIRLFIRIGDPPMEFREGKIPLLGAQPCLEELANQRVISILLGAAPAATSEEAYLLE